MRSAMACSAPPRACRWRNADVSEGLSGCQVAGAAGWPLAGLELPCTAASGCCGSAPPAPAAAAGEGGAASSGAAVRTSAAAVPADDAAAACPSACRHAWAARTSASRWRLSCGKSSTSRSASCLQTAGAWRAARPQAGHCSATAAAPPAGARLQLPGPVAAAAGLPWPLPPLEQAGRQSWQTVWPQMSTAGRHSRRPQRGASHAKCCGRHWPGVGGGGSGPLACGSGEVAPTSSSSSARRAMGQSAQGWR